LEKEILLFFFLCIGSLFEHICKLSLQELVGIHLFQFVDLVVFEGLKTVFIVPNEVPNLQKSSFLELHILLNVEESWSTSKNSYLILEVFKGIVDRISLLKLDGVDSWILDLLVATSI